ncbi:uncharacterized protein ARMOST_07628 [Armillaria ostoyae]|uniref:Uncharacterized protein n=1 Tax=Armillaria ostoyae TaxID=47428 RepID=A0A284R6C2_ARMOS|nr:uncharacterized protein ARMOST_07628 [Armillaria ostoyae]
MSGHFILALQIPSLMQTRRHIHQSDSNTNDATFDCDIDTSLEIEANVNDAEAINTTDFTPGDIVRKLLAFIAEVNGGGEQALEYLLELCRTNGYFVLQVKTWVRTQWESMSDCFDRMLESERQSMDVFSVLADSNPDIPPLTGGKHFSDYKLTNEEWDTVSLAAHALRISASSHGELSAEKTPTCQKVYPIINRLQSRWEVLSEDPKYELIWPG